MEQWRAEYWDNPTLSGSPRITRTESPDSAWKLGHSWGSSDPIPGVIAAGRFSARWLGCFPFEAGRYRFRGAANDGVRVSVDGVRVVDAWLDQTAAQPFEGSAMLTPTVHQVLVEFYENSDGNAVVLLTWEKGAQ